MHGIIGGSADASALCLDDRAIGDRLAPDGASPHADSPSLHSAFFGSVRRGRDTYGSLGCWEPSDGAGAMMTQRLFAMGGVLGLALAVGCGGQKPDGAAAPRADSEPPAAHLGSETPVGESPPMEESPPSEEAPYTAEPLSETAPPAEVNAYTLSPRRSFAPSAAPAMIPNDGGYPLAAAPEEAPPAAAPLAPETSAFPESTAPETIPHTAAPEAAAPDSSYDVVEVFYGTDRNRLDTAPPGFGDYVQHYRSALGVMFATLLSAGGLLLRSQRRASAAISLSGVCVAGALALMAATRDVSSSHVAVDDRVQYGDGRGSLEMGLCRVSIPKDHRTGEIESPSILRFEFREDPEKHVTILEARAYEPDAFFGRLQETMARARRRELLVFVHGYNVAFDSAVRRTAQIAYDLKFPGAAVCYSWPSHGGLLLYAADENNVEWTAPHLKQFLTQIRRESGAEAINLVGHSMGTRAVTNVVREFARESEEQGTIFHQVVLAAPDIDAEVFRRDLAPALARTAERVTLYASSNDQALLASRKLHAYPRAGESGPNLVVTPGIDTIDVSAIDTSFLGHSYYGDNDSIISDLFRLVHEALPPERRERLQPAYYAGLPYWVFLPATAQASLPGAGPAR
jgi:esterase/lipase superfamily enzyme